MSQGRKFSLHYLQKPSKPQKCRLLVVVHTCMLSKKSVTFILQYVFCRLQVYCCFTLHNLKIRVSSFPHWRASGVSYPFPQPLPSSLSFFPLELSYNWVQLERNIASKELCKTFSLSPLPFKMNRNVKASGQ